MNETPAARLLVQETAGSRRGAVMSYLSVVTSIGLAVAIGAEWIGPGWGWLAITLSVLAGASRLHDMLWRIWVEVVPPDELARRLRAIGRSE